MEAPRGKRGFFFFYIYVHFNYNVHMHHLVFEISITKVNTQNEKK